MTIVPDFKGRPRTPSDSESDLAFHVFDYCKEHLGLKPSDLYQKDLGLAKGALDGQRAGRTKKHHSAFLASLYAYLIAKNAAGSYHRLDQIHTWMLGPVCTLLPELRAYFRRGPSLFHQRIEAVASQSENAREKVISCFGGGKYIYRYARNSEDDAIRIAKGRLTLTEEIDDIQFNEFLIEYEAAPRRRGARSKTIWIEGNVFLIKAHFMFFGVEKGTDNAFIMVVRDEGPSEEYGALILRKHHDRGFMATKGLVMSSTNVGDVIGALDFKEVPEIDHDLQGLLMNIGNHKGKGPLTLPDT